MKVKVEETRGFAAQTLLEIGPFSIVRVQDSLMKGYVLFIWIGQTRAAVLAAAAKSASSAKR